MIKKEGIPAGYHRRKTMTYEQVKQDEAVRVYIDQADASLKALGFTEHSFQHVTRVAQTAGWILETLGYPERTVELVKIAGYLHDIGNVVDPPSRRIRPNGWSGPANGRKCYSQKQVKGHLIIETAFFDAAF